jgi:hypothetical protein
MRKRETFWNHGKYSASKDSNGMAKILRSVDEFIEHAGLEKLFGN